MPGDSADEAEHVHVVILTTRSKGQRDHHVRHVFSTQEAAKRWADDQLGSHKIKRVPYDDSDKNL